MNNSKKNRVLGRCYLVLVFLFLYLPIASVIAYSFNESRLATIWSGFSFKWYGELFDDRELISAGWLSLKLALMTAFASVVIGTWVGFVLAKFGRFKGATLFSGMVNAPLVLPEVIQGISLLLLFVAMQQVLGWPEGRGLTTIWIGHVMLSISYVAITVRSRLVSIDPALAEAAQDLGASPIRVFADITLPLISQALISGWLLAFTISFDDFVMSAFLSGPGSTTLPLVVFSRARLGLSPEVNALAAIFIVVVTIAVVAGNHLLLRRERRREREIHLALNHC